MFAQRIPRITVFNFPSCAVSVRTSKPRKSLLFSYTISLAKQEERNESWKILIHCHLGKWKLSRAKVEELARVCESLNNSCSQNRAEM